MKIAFLCSSLEPRHDGVGDYCRRLGEGLIALGHEVLLLALNDRWIEAPAFESGKLGIQRIPAGLSMEHKLAEAQAILRAFRPDWLSLQYVCYSYHPKGLPWKWNRMFAQLREEAPHRHLMLHELWVGEFPGCPWQHRLLGQLQRWIVRSLTQVWEAEVMHTSIPIYGRMLKKNQIRASLLPLFGNIPLTVALPSFLDGLTVLPFLSTNGNDRENFLLGLHFGTWHPDADPIPFLKTLLHEAKARRLIPCILAVGSVGLAGQQAIRSLRATFGPELLFTELGRQSGETISQLMQVSDFGLNTGYHQLLGKSGAFAALVEHGLPVMAFSGGPTEPTTTIDDFRARGWEQHFSGGGVDRISGLLEASFRQTLMSEALPSLKT